MDAPKNKLKSALKSRKTQIGCWFNLADPVGAEIVGRAGFDWVLIDGEHGPNSIKDIAHQLQVLEGLPTSSVVRAPIGETAIIKQILDAGVQSLLIPMVESANEAHELVAAVRYPPVGKRGVGAFVARAAQFGNLSKYLQTADEQICLIVQLETTAGLLALDDILEVDGIDGVFIGPADLAANMGYLGNPQAEEVQKAILDALQRISASGKAAGILSLDDKDTETYLSAGARFVGVASDVLSLNQALRAKAKKWRKKYKRYQKHKRKGR